MHAHQYELEQLRELFPDPAIQQATQTIARIAQITEDKAMYDAREKAIRDRQWELNASFREEEARGREEGKEEGKKEGEIKLIRTLQELLHLPASSEQHLHEIGLDELQTLTATLQETLRSRMS